MKKKTPNVSETIKLKAAVKEWVDATLDLARREELVIRGRDRVACAEMMFLKIERGE